jgi:hypothetical protein
MCEVDWPTLLGFGNLLVTAVTAFIVYWYTTEAKKTRLIMQEQSTNMTQQLDLLKQQQSDLRLEREEQRLQLRNSMRPILSATPNRPKISMADEKPVLIIPLINHGATITQVHMDSPDIRLTFEKRLSSKYIERGSLASGEPFSVAFRSPEPFPMTFRIDVHYLNQQGQSDSVSLQCTVQEKFTGGPPVLLDVFQIPRPELPVKSAT